MTIRPDASGTPRPIPVAKTPPKAAAEAKAQGSPAQLINRQYVADALDRTGDGIVSREELESAGITRVEAEALRVINEPGEQGEAITVAELARALAADRVVITSKGLVTIENARGKLNDGAIAPSTPWEFPQVEDMRILEEFHRQIPRMGRYSPDWPDSYYVDRVFDGYEKVKVGTRRVEVGKDASGEPIYREEDIFEERAKYRDEIQYDRLWRDMRRKAEDVLEMSRNASDPSLKAAREAIEKATNASGGWVWGYESSCRTLYRALNQLDDIKVPATPETYAKRLDAALNATAKSLDEQDRITRDIPVEKARKAIEGRVAHLKGASPANFVAGGLAAAAGGVGGYFALAAGVLAGGPLIAAAAGLAVVAGSLGWGIAQLVKAGRAKGMLADLSALKAIDPAGNRKEMEQHALAAYRLLQDARTADFLGAVRAFEADAKKVETALGAVKTRTERQTQQIRNVEQIVLRYKD